MSVNWGMAGAVRPDPYGAYLDARDRREQRDERLEARQQERTTRSANEAWARALAADDLAAARDIAAKAGSPEAVQQVNEQVQRRVRQEAVRFNTELQDIAQLYATDPATAQARYSRLYASTLQRASRWGLDRLHPEAMEQFRATYPTPDDPQFGARLPQALESSTQSVRGLMTQDMTPEQWAENNRGPEWRPLPADQLPAGARYGERNQRTGETDLDWAPQDRSTTTAENRDWTRANTLRDEYNTQTAGYRTVADYATRSEEYIRRITRNPQTRSGQGDVGLVYALAKIYDPTSVVREGEFAMVARQGGYGEQMRSWVEQALGRGFSEEIRNQIMAEIRNGLAAAERQRDQTRDRYTDLAVRGGIDPADVIDDYAVGGVGPSAGGGDEGDAEGEAEPLPPVAQRRRGVRYTMQDGGTAEWDGSRFINFRRPGE